MDSGSTVTGSCTHKNKLLKRQKANKGESIFSKLPEPLISRILSLLPTKDAVRTSVLSKRWIYRWRSITKLDLDDSVFYSPKKRTGGKQYFVNFVYRALLLTKCSSIESFCLVIANKYDASLVNTWISNILNRRVKNLGINSHLELSFSALTSDSLFNSNSLEELVLEMYRCAITVPTTFVHFGLLRFLKLSGIKFTLDSSSNSQYLSLSFPVLKRFETLNCTWLRVKALTLKMPLLERVFIEHDPNSPSYEPHCCAIKFSASHLTEFTYRGYGYISQYIFLLDQSSAHNASANIILYQCEKDRIQETENRAVLLLKQFCQVKYLKFEGLEVLAQSKLAALPAFGMLSHLELGLVTCEVLLGLLLKSPVLKTLIFKGLSEFDQELLNSATVPDCLLSTLQVVKFGNVHGYEHELCLAKFMMENGLVLERMSFFLPSWLGKSKAIEEFKEKLFSFKKGFSFAIVEFSYG